MKTLKKITKIKNLELKKIKGGMDNENPNYNDYYEDYLERRERVNQKIWG